MLFSLVSTIFNEATRLPQTIADLEAQTIKPAEIIITDPGSSDNSWEILTEWQKKSPVPIVLLKEEGCNVARGRNLAIKSAKYELIVSTDFGCRFHPEWLKSLISPFEEDVNLQVVGGAFSVIENEIETYPARANYILTNGYQTIIDDGFIPSSRSIAYKKSVWKAIGGYPEWLTLAADDLVFGLQIKAKQIPITIVNNPYVYWGRHSKIKQYNKEAFRYGLGDGEAKVNNRNFLILTAETLLRYTFILSLLLLLVHILAGGPRNYLITGLLLFSLTLGLVGFRPYFRTAKYWNNLRSNKYNVKSLLIGLFMIETQRFHYIKGYLKGFFCSNNLVRSEAKQLQNLLNSNL